MLGSTLLTSCWGSAGGMLPVLEASGVTVIAVCPSGDATLPPRKGLSLSVSLSDRSTPIGENINGGLSMSGGGGCWEGDAVVVVFVSSSSVRAVAVGEAALVTVSTDAALRGDGDEALLLLLLLEDDLLVEREGLDDDELLVDDSDEGGVLVVLEEEVRFTDPRADRVGGVVKLRLGERSTEGCPKLSACPLRLRVGDVGTRLRVGLDSEPSPFSMPLRSERVGLRRLDESIFPTLAKKASETPMGGNEGECSF